VLMKNLKVQLLRPPVTVRCSGGFTRKRALGFG